MYRFYIYVSRIAGQSYQKGMVMFKFLAYYAIPLLVITGFYLGMARHLELSTRNMPGELSTGCHRMEQIKARKKVRRRKEKIKFIHKVQILIDKSSSK